MTMNSNSNDTAIDDDKSPLSERPNKTRIKRECDHLLDIGDEILKLKPEEIDSLELPTDLEAAVQTALKIKSRSGLKRQRQYIGKLLRNIESDDLESRLRKIQHRHDTNTAQFKRLERWRDDLIENNKATLNEIIEQYPDIDRQHINQLIRRAHQEQKQSKAPASSRKLFKYLRELEDL